MTARLPEQSSLSLTDAIKYIAEKTSESISRGQIQKTLYLALREGAVRSRGDLENSDKKIIKRNLSMPIKAWENISLEDFCINWANRRIIEKSTKSSSGSEKEYYVNITIARKDLETWLFSKQNQSNRSANNYTSDYKTGAPGRPTSVFLLEAELNERARRDELEPTLSKQVDSLLEWLRSTHPQSPPIKKKAAENALRVLYKSLKSKTNKKP